MRKITRRVARFAIWRAVRLIATRLGLPWFVWPILWVVRRVAHHLRKRAERRAGG